MPWEEGSSSVGCDEGPEAECFSLSTATSSTSLGEAVSERDDDVRMVKARALEGEDELF